MTRRLGHVPSLWAVWVLCMSACVARHDENSGHSDPIAAGATSSPVESLDPIESRPQPATLPSSADDSGELLALARASLATGQLDDNVAQRLIDSPAPEHARARRILSALAENPGEGARGNEAGAPQSVHGGAQVPSVPVDTAAPAVAPSAVPTTERGKPVSRPPVVSAGPLELHGVGLKRNRGGVAVTLRTNRGLLVGVVEQPGAGLVYLMLDHARMAADLGPQLARVDGVTLGSIEPMGTGVRVSLRLAAGWRVGAISRRGYGAQIQLQGPAGVGEASSP